MFSQNQTGKVRGWIFVSSVLKTLYLLFGAVLTSATNETGENENRTKKAIGIFVSIAGMAFFVVLLHVVVTLGVRF